MRYATTYILVCTLVLGEVHTFWETNQSGREIQNWILNNYKPMSVQWNVKYLTDQILPILYFIAMLKYRRNRINEATVKTWIYFSILDMIMYFYNYKTYQYGGVYLWVVLIWVLTYWGKDIASFLWKHIKLWGKP